MENNLSLNEEIDEVVNKKLTDCNCNPCSCSEQTKDEYFQKLKCILKKYNTEYLNLNNMRMNFFDQSAKQIHNY
jgi:hypothetical protein